MAKFSYKAISNDSGKVVRGVVDAGDLATAEARVMELGMYPIDLKQSGSSKLSFGLSFGGLSKKGVITFFIYMRELNRAGVSILDALENIKTMNKDGPMKRIASSLHVSIMSGKLLSAAMLDYEKTFSKIYINLVSAAENTGELHEAFDSIISHMRWTIDIKRKISKATRYPTFLLFLMFGVITLMMGFVVPKIIKFIVEQDIPIPWYTALLVKISGWFSANLKLIIGSVVGAVIAIKLMKFIPTMRRIIDIVKLNMPIIGSIVMKIEMTRFSHFFATAFKGGIGLIESLELSRGVIMNIRIKEIIGYVIEGVGGGKLISDTIGEHKHFSPLVIQMFKVGEQSGNMQQALENIKFFYDREVNDSIDNLVGIIQPTMMFVVGGMMLAIITSVFGPLYSMFQNFKG